MPEENRPRFSGAPIAIGSVPRFGGTSVGEQVLMRGATPSQPVSRPIAGGLEAAATIASASLTEPIAGAAGIYELVRGLVSGDDDYVVDAVNRIGQVQDIGTYTPKTDTGQQYVESLGEFFKPFEEFAGRRGESARQSFAQLGDGMEGSLPARLSAATEYTAVMMAPSVLGVPGVVRRSAARSSGLKDIRGIEDLSGIDSGAGVRRQAAQMGESVLRATGGQSVRATNFDDIQNAVIRAREIRRTETGRLFDQARESKAFIPMSEVSRLPQMIRSSLEDFDIDAMPVVSKRLQEIESFLQDSPQGASGASLNSLAQFRQRINRNRPAANDLSQNTALGIMKGEIDAIIDSVFDADMISGDPAAVSRWRGANQAYRQYREDFTANKVIRRLSEQAATPEEVRNWILGSSRVGGKAQSGEVVSRMKNILGEDSPQVASVRQEILFDLLEPMLGENPNIKAFATRHDQFFRNNPTLARELFPESLPEITALRRMSGAIERSTGAQFQMELDATLARALFGHALAKGQVRIGIARNVLNLIHRSATQPGRQRQIMADLIGYDPLSPVIPPSQLAIPSAIPATLESAENLAQMKRDEGIQ
jgi:hypothetical protein